MRRYTAKNEDDDVGQVFVNKLEKIVKQIYQQFKFPKEMIFTEKDCHLTGRYRGAAHKD